MIDSKLQSELRAKYNPDGSNLRKMQLRMLEMLKYIDNICRENNIKYWLSSGTCLGAVRHGGFIPWDDDADIEMLASDYRKLEKILRNASGDFVLQDYKSDPEYIHIYAKLRDTKSKIKENNDSDKYNRYNGIFIDLFVLEPSNYKFLFRICGSLWCRIAFKCPKIKNKLFRQRVIKLYNLILRKILFQIVRIFNSVPVKDQLRHVLGSCFIRPRSNGDITEVVYVPFEDTVLPIPKGYDHYLQLIYGNWQKMPNMDNIDTHVVSCEIN